MYSTYNGNIVKIHQPVLVIVTVLITKRWEYVRLGAILKENDWIQDLLHVHSSISSQSTPWDDYMYGVAKQKFGLMHKFTNRCHFSYISVFIPSLLQFKR